MLSEPTRDTSSAHYPPPSDSVHRSRHRVRHDISVEVVGERPAKTSSDGLRSMHYYQNWVNSIFMSQDIGHVDNLTAAFSNGKFIVTLTQLVIGEKMIGVKNDPVFLKQRLENTQKCFELLAKKGLEIEDVTPEDLVNGKRVSIKTFCKTLQKENKKSSIAVSKSLDLSKVGKSTSKSNSGNPTSSVELEQKINKSHSADLFTSVSEQTETTAGADLSLEEIRIEDKPDTTQPVQTETSVKKSSDEADIPNVPSDKQNSSESKPTEIERGKLVHKPSLEIPPHRTSNKFLPSTPQKSIVTTEDGVSEGKLSSHNKELEEDVKNKQTAELKVESKVDDEDTKVLRSKKSSKEESGWKFHSKQKRYSPLDITKLAGRLFDAFSTFSTSDEHLSEQNTEETRTEEIPTASDGRREASDITTTQPTPVESAPTVDTQDPASKRDSLTVLPPLALDDLTPEAGEKAVQKDAKRILRKNKRQATVIESQEVLQARKVASQEEEFSHLPLDSNSPGHSPIHLTQDSISSVTESEDVDKSPDVLKEQKSEKSSQKINHRFRALSQQRGALSLTEAHSMEDVWQELQRMKATVRTHHSLANRFAQDYPVMRRCFESQTQSVRKLERIQHVRGRDVEKELQDKLALMEGYLVQTMRENADLRSKVWGLTTRLTQLEKAGGSSRPSSILSFGDVHKREHLGIQDISKHKRTLKLKKFFGEEPPPLLEEIPTSFTHDTSKEDDEIV